MRQCVLFLEATRWSVKVNSDCGVIGFVDSKALLKRLFTPSVDNFYSLRHRTSGLPGWAEKSDILRSQRTNNTRSKFFTRVLCLLLKLPHTIFTQTAVGTRILTVIKVVSRDPGNHIWKENIPGFSFVDLEESPILKKPVPCTPLVIHRPLCREDVGDRGRQEFRNIWLHHWGTKRLVDFCCFSWYLLLMKMCVRPENGWQAERTLFNS